MGGVRTGPGWGPDIDGVETAGHGCTMAAAGKTIHDLEGKVNAIAHVLFEAGQIRSCSTRAVATAANINYQTLKSALPQSRVSPEIEQGLCILGRFSPNEAEWCDAKQEPAERRKSPEHYSGNDTVKAFRAMLRAKWLAPISHYRVQSESIAPVDPDLACHEFTDCKQSTTHPTEIQLFFEASFGVMWCDGVQYGLRTVRVNLRFVDDDAGEFDVKVARDTPAIIRDAAVLFSGTSSLPCWHLYYDGSAEGLLEGVYRTTDAPFVTVAGYHHGTRLRSTLYANLNDSFVTLDPAVGSVSDNQRAIIEVVCAGGVPEERRRLGVVELCRQDIVLMEDRHAQAA